MKKFSKVHLFFLGLMFLCVIFAKEVIDSSNFWNLMCECGLIRDGHGNPYDNPVVRKDDNGKDIPAEIVVDPSELKDENLVGIYCRVYYCLDGNITDTYNTGSIYLRYNPGEYLSTKDIESVLKFKSECPDSDSNYSRDDYKMGLNVIRSQLENEKRKLKNEIKDVEEKITEKMNSFPEPSTITICGNSVTLTWMNDSKYDAEYKINDESALGKALKAHNDAKLEMEKAKNSKLTQEDLDILKEKVKKAQEEYDSEDKLFKEKIEEEAKSIGQRFKDQRNKEIKKLRNDLNDLTNKKEEIERYLGKVEVLEDECNDTVLKELYDGYIKERKSAIITLIHELFHAHEHEIYKGEFSSSEDKDIREGFATVMTYFAMHESANMSINDYKKELLTPEYEGYFNKFISNIIEFHNQNKEKTEADWTETDIYDKEAKDVAKIVYAYLDGVKGSQQCTAFEIQQDGNQSLDSSGGNVGGGSGSGNGSEGGTGDGGGKTGLSGGEPGTGEMSPETGTPPDGVQTGDPDSGESSPGAGENSPPEADGGSIGGEPEIGGPILPEIGAPNPLGHQRVLGIFAE